MSVTQQSQIYCIWPATSLYTYAFLPTADWQGMPCALGINMFLMTCTAERSWRCVGEMLIRARLFHLPELDAQLVRMISAGRSNLATDLAVHLVRTCLVGDPVVTAADLFNTLDTLAKIARHSSNGPAVLMLVEQARQVTRSASSPPQPCCLLHFGVSTC